MTEKKRKSNTWTIILTIIILLLIGLGIWAYFSQNTIQYGPGCAANEAMCNGQCQKSGLACSQCPPKTPFMDNTGACTSTPTNIGS